MTERNNDEVEPTAEVGSEGGSPGDVEVERPRTAGTGSESTETWVEDDADDSPGE
jgi:hypothetical protein